MKKFVSKKKMQNTKAVKIYLLNKSRDNVVEKDDKMFWKEIFLKPT